MVTRVSTLVSFSPITALVFLEQTVDDCIVAIEGRMLILSCLVEIEPDLFVPQKLTKFVQRCEVLLRRVNLVAKEDEANTKVGVF